METTISKWGNSFGVRIPQAFVKQIGLEEGMTLAMDIVGDSIIIRPIQYSLDEMLKKITPDNIHSEVKEGPSKGKEAW